MDGYFQRKVLKGPCGGGSAEGSCQAKRLRKDMNHKDHRQNRPTSLRKVMLKGSVAGNTSDDNNSKPHCAVREAS